MKDGEMCPSWSYVAGVTKPAWAGLCGHIAPTAIRLTLVGPKSAKSENNKLWLACIFGPQDCASAYHIRNEETGALRVPHRPNHAPNYHEERQEMTGPA